MTASQRPAEEGLLPDALLLAKDAVENGVVAAPSLAIQGAFADAFILLPAR